jgi:hypothetical protein
METKVARLRPAMFERPQDLEELESADPALALYFASPPRRGLGPSADGVGPQSRGGSASTNYSLSPTNPRTLSLARDKRSEMPEITVERLTRDANLRHGPDGATE